MIFQYRNSSNGHRAVLKWDGSAHSNGWPKTVFVFLLDSEVRKILGRWIETPNASLIKFVKDRGALK